MRKQNSIIRILILVFAVLIVLLLIGGGSYLLIAKNKVKEISLQPEFAETSLEVGTQYTFAINTTPSGANIKKATCTVDDPTSSFEINDDGKAVLTTGLNEGNITLFVECKGVKSQVLTYSIVDSVARAQAEAAAQAEAQKKAEEEAAAAQEAEAAAAAAAKKYVKCTGDDVNVRASASKEGESLGKASKGYLFEKIDEEGEWTHIKYKDGEGYIKTEFVTEISEEEYNEGGPSEAETKKEDEKKEEEKKTEAQSKEEAEKKVAEDQAKAAEDAAKLEEDLKKQQEALLAQQAAAAAAQSYTLSGVPVSAAEYKFLLDMFRFATPNGTDAEAKAEVEIHSGGEIIQILKDKGYRQ